MSDAVTDELDRYLRAAVAQLTGGENTLTRWALVFEVSDGDTRIVRVTSSDGSTMQDLVGMFTWALQFAQRRIARILDVLDE